MCMNLCFRFYSTVNKSECRNCKIKIFAIPVRLSKWKFFTKCSLINLNNINTICFKVKNFISNCKCNLKYTFLNCYIFSREWPVKDCNRACKHTFNFLSCTLLSELTPLYCNAFLSWNITPNNRWFNTSCSIWLNPSFFSEYITW